jgi:hypothetical protein
MSQQESGSVQLELVVSKDSPSADASGLPVEAEMLPTLRILEESGYNALGDRGLLAHYTRAILEENGLSYQEQETRTGVPMAVVHRMVHGRVVRLSAVRQFAAAAARLTHREDTRLYWLRLFERLSRLPGRADLDNSGSRFVGFETEEVVARFSLLRSSASREAVLRLIAALESLEESSPPTRRAA